MIQEFDNNVLDLVKQKGYEYEYIRDFDKFKEQLPNNDKFYSSLTDRKISYKEYEHVLNVWEKIEIKMMKDYLRMFEKVRNNSLRNYGLCPSHYLSAPGLSWDAMLKMTKIELEIVLEIVPNC